jgi:hypothetical protein
MASRRAPAVRVAGRDRAEGGHGAQEGVGGHRGGADDEEGQGPGDADRRCQAPPGHPAAPDYPGAGHPTEHRRRSDQGAVTRPLELGPLDPAPVA